MKKNRICSICGKKFSGYYALSRTDNKTKICADCGTREAVDAYYKFMKKVYEIFDMERAGKHEE